MALPLVAPVPPVSGVPSALVSDSHLPPAGDWTLVVIVRGIAPAAGSISFAVIDWGVGAAPPWVYVKLRLPGETITFSLTVGWVRCMVTSTICVTFPEVSKIFVR